MSLHRLRLEAAVWLASLIALITTTWALLGLIGWAIVEML
jgi:Na+/proline symporter